jgi:hypothetical protein
VTVWAARARRRLWVARSGREPAGPSTRWCAVHRMGVGVGVDVKVGDGRKEHGQDKVNRELHARKGSAARDPASSLFPPSPPCGLTSTINHCTHATHCTHAAHCSPLRPPILVLLHNLNSPGNIARRLLSTAPSRHACYLTHILHL